MATEQTTAEIATLALNHAIAADLDDAQSWADSCVWVYRMITTQIPKFGISSGHVFQCLMLADMGFISGPTDINTKDDLVWVAA